MGILKRSFDGESTDTACWLVVRMLAACCGIMKTLCIIFILSTLAIFLTQAFPSRGIRER